MSRLFFKKIYTEKTDGNTAQRSFKHYVGGFVIGLIVLFALAYGAFNFGLFLNNVFRNWQEIKFAYNKPAIVKHMREDYQKKQTTLDSSFTNPQPAPKSGEEQLVEEVVDKLKDINLK